MNREGMKKYLAAEMCHTVNDHWGIGKNDINYKSPKELIENLCDCRRNGANYLLNIGPEAQGAVNSYQRELFGLIGKWMSIFGEAIYNGRPYPAFSVGKNFILKTRIRTLQSEELCLIMISIVFHLIISDWGMQ